MIFPALLLNQLMAGCRALKIALPSRDRTRPDTALNVRHARMASWAFFADLSRSVPVAARMRRYSSENSPTPSRIAISVRSSIPSAWAYAFAW